MVWQAVLAALGGVQQGYAEYQQGKETKKLLDFNANQYAFLAADALTRGYEAERRLREGAGLIDAEQTAAFASQNVETSSGSALAVTMDTARLSELDALQIRNNARMEAYGYKVEAASSRYQGHLAKKQGKQKAIGTVLGASGKAFAPKPGST